MALNGDTRISQETRRRIEAIANELGYKRQVRTNSRPTIAVIFSEPGEKMISPYFHQAFEAIIDEVMVADGRLLVTRCDEPSDVEECLNSLSDSGARGAIVLGGNPSKALLQGLLDVDFPFICVGKRSVPDKELSWISSDYLQGSRQAVEHLISLGHKRIAVALNPRYELEWYMERVLGYQVAMSAAGLAEGPRWIIDDVNQAAQVLRSDCSGSNGVTAAFAINYSTADRLLRACMLAGIDVPETLAIVGFDDQPEAESLNPPLTTVRQPLQAIGSLAARNVLAWIQGTKQSVIQVRLSTSLIIRESCGAHLQTQARKN